MDLNNIFLLVIVASTLGLTACLFLLGIPLTLTWKPILSFAFLLIVVGISFKFAPTNAGYISLIFWLWLILLPIVANRLLSRYLNRQQYRQAYSLARFMARFYFYLSNWREQPDVIQLLELGQQGNLAQAARLLAQYERTKPDSPLYRFARSYLYALNGQWEELVQWVENAKPQNKIFAIDPDILLFYLRALGEIGELDRQIAIFNQHRRRLAKRRRSNQAYLFMFAFCGESAAVAQLLQGPLKSFSPPLKQLWLATANLSSGAIEQGMQQLNILLQNEKWLIRTSAQRRISHPLIMARYQLSLANQNQIAGLIYEIKYKKRFKLAASLRHSKAYLTYILISLNLLYFLLEVTAGGSENSQTLYRLGGLVVPDVITTGEWWRVLAAQFIHIGPIHLIINMLAFVWFSPFVETRLGKWRYLLLYFATGTGSLLVAVLLAQLHFFPRSAIAGASGGLMGLVGAMGAIALRDWWNEATKIARNIFIVILIAIGVQVVFDLIIFPQASFIGHLSGAILGFLIASQLKHLPIAPKDFTPPVSESLLK
jgi:rhomboid protease GluP